MKALPCLPLVVVAFMAPAVAAAETPKSLMQGKVMTDRSIILEAVIDAPPARVFQLWTTESEIPKFFGPKAVIEPRLGGKYEMIFQPKADPLGDDAGTRGARIIRFERNRRLSFEWPSFTRTGPGSHTPIAWPEQRDARPIPTWVDVRFDPVPDNPQKTRVRFAEHGFQSGGKWDESIKFFWNNWAIVLGQLGAYCARGCGG